ALNYVGVQFTPIFGVPGIVGVTDGVPGHAVVGSGAAAGGVPDGLADVDEVVTGGGHLIQGLPGTGIEGASAVALVANEEAHAIAGAFLFGRANGQVSLRQMYIFPTIFALTPDTPIVGAVELIVTAFLA